MYFYSENAFETNGIECRVEEEHVNDTIETLPQRATDLPSPKVWDDSHVMAVCLCFRAREYIF